MVGVRWERVCVRHTLKQIAPCKKVSGVQAQHRHMARAMDGVAARPATVRSMTKQRVLQKDVRGATQHIQAVRQRRR